MTQKFVAAAARLFALALLCLAAATLPASADGIEPGLWQITETIIMNGNRTPSQMRTRCLSAEQAGDTATTFSPEYRTVNSDCERAEFSSTASRLKWRMLCKGQLDMDVSGDFDLRHAQALQREDRVQGLRGRPDDGRNQRHDRRRAPRRVQVIPSPSPSSGGGPGRRFGLE